MFNKLIKLFFIFSSLIFLSEVSINFCFAGDDLEREGLAIRAFGLTVGADVIAGPDLFNNFANQLDNEIPYSGLTFGWSAAGDLVSINLISELEAEIPSFKPAAVPEVAAATTHNEVFRPSPGTDNFYLPGLKIDQVYFAKDAPFSIQQLIVRNFDNSGTRYLRQAAGGEWSRWDVGGKFGTDHPIVMPYQLFYDDASRITGIKLVCLD